MPILQSSFMITDNTLCDIWPLFINRISSRMQHKPLIIMKPLVLRGVQYNDIGTEIQERRFGGIICTRLIYIHVNSCLLIQHCYNIMATIYMYSVLLCT